MRDTRNYTVLTYAAYRNQTNCFKILFEYAWKYQNLNNSDYDDEKFKKFQKWVNTVTEDEFTALHFATRHANYTILNLLVEKVKKI